MYNKPMRLNAFFGPSVHGSAPDRTRADLFGVELELEGQRVRTDDPKINRLWALHNDNSLRRRNPEDDALEYVFAKPYDKPTSMMAIQLLFNYLNKDDVKVYDSYRTSTHVHVNFLQDTYRTLFNFITLAIITDELLVSQNGDHRVGNNFCLRFVDAPAMIETLVRSVDRHGNINDISRDDRYGSVNLASLFKFGSIEFRSLECTTDYERLDHWISTLQAMKDVARDYANPADIITDFSQLGVDRFLYKVLGGHAMKYLRVDGYKDMLQRGMRLAQDWAFCSEWKLDESDQPVKGSQRQSLEDMIARQTQEMAARTRMFAAPPPPPGAQAVQFDDLRVEPELARPTRTRAGRIGTATRAAQAELARLNAVRPVPAPPPGVDVRNPFLRRPAVEVAADGAWMTAFNTPLPDENDERDNF